MIPAADLPTRLAALPGWPANVSGVSREYPIGWDADVHMVADVCRLPGRGAILTPEFFLVSLEARPSEP